MTNTHAGFWSWSLERYERNGVAETLLHLQDEHELSVNLLLWCCWCAETYEPCSHSAMQQAEQTTGLWSERVTAPLRSVRRYLKTGEDEEKKQRKALRKIVKDAELQAEKVEQARLENLAVNHLKPLTGQGPPYACIDRAKTNLSLYAKIAGASETPALTELLQKLIDKIFSNNANNAPAERDQS